MDVYKNTHYPATDNATGQKIEKYACTTPIDFVGFPVKQLKTQEIDLELRHDFNFLCVAQIGPRKMLMLFSIISSKNSRMKKLDCF